MIAYCYNKLSFNSSISKDYAFRMLTNALQGIAYYNRKIKSSGYIYFADNDIKDMCLCTNYSYLEYLKELEDKDKDLYEMILGMEDRAPYLNYITDENSIYKYNGCCIDGYETGNLSDLDLLLFAYISDSILISMNTHEIWNNNSVDIDVFKDNIPNKVTLYNISCKGHGKELYQITLQLPKIDDIVYMPQFQSFFEKALINEDSRKRNIINSIRKASLYNFNMANNLIKPISGSHIMLYELKCDHKSSGGTGRILFYKSNPKIYFLLGWIKKSNDDGYEQYIKQAQDIVKSIEN